MNSINLLRKNERKAALFSASHDGVFQFHLDGTPQGRFEYSLQSNLGIIAESVRRERRAIVDGRIASLQFGMMSPEPTTSEARSHRNKMQIAAH